MNLIKLIDPSVYNFKIFNAETARFNILRFVLPVVFIISILIFVFNLTYKACVCIQLPSDNANSGRKLTAAAEFKIMHSGELISAALKKVLKLKGVDKAVDIKSEMIGGIKKNLHYKYDGESMIFELEYFDRSRDYAVKIVNALAEAYVSDYAFGLNEISNKTLQMLYMKQLEAEKSLSSANLRYEKYCAAENIINVDNDYMTLMSEYSGYKDELTKINAEISIAEKLAEKNHTYRPGRKLAAVSGEERLTPPYARIEDSDENYELKKKINDAEIKLAMLKKKYTSAHPLVKNEIMLLEILKNKITYSGVESALQDNKFLKAGPGERTLDFLKAKRNTYLEFAGKCENKIKEYPKKRQIIKSYEIEISKIENLLTAINKQIDETRISQAGLSNNMPRIIEAGGAARLNIDYIAMSAALMSLLFFVMSFKFENKVQAIEQNQKLLNYKNVVADDFNYKTLGHINKSAPLNFEDSSFSAGCFAYHQKDSRQSKFVNIIRNNIINQLDKNTGCVFGLTSLNPSEGKTLLAANIGISSALSGQSTLVVDLNYKTTRPPAGDYYKVDNLNGVTDIIVGETPYEEVVADTAIEELKMIPTGILPPNVQKVMSSPVCSEFINSVSQKFGLVIADCPAFSISSDFHAVTGFIKNIALIIDVDKISSVEDFKEELAAFDNYVRSSNLYVLGVIFNEK